jgi:hypothetical protein
VKIEEVLALEESVVRTASLAAWIQNLYEDETTTPVLVGGAAVELYTQGAYTTGDLDLVGSVTRGVARALEGAGFERHGRHWIHEDAQVFVEFPGESLEPEERALWLDIGGVRLLVISVEDLLVDRLGAWEYWQSSVDGVNAFVLLWEQRESIDVERLEQRVTRAGWKKAWQSLTEFAARWQSDEPPLEEIEAWAIEGP